MDLPEIATQIKGIEQNIVLIYAFNGTGKTRLAVAYKDATKNEDNGQHSGVYYNAFSEDLFVWDNDTDNDEENIKLTINPSSLNQYHNLLTEDAIREKLTPYNAKYDFYFNLHDDTEQGIKSIQFYVKDDDETPIKISRGEERIFVWCLYLALFEVDGWADKQNLHFFIDDPVSSLDDHNIFVTATTLYNLVESHSENRKIIITTHHIGLFSILSDWLTKGEKATKYKPKTKIYILKNGKDGQILETPKNNIFLSHLQLLQTLDKANQEQLYTYHFALLRQVLENISSFLGVGQIKYVLQQIGIDEEDEVVKIVNTLTHKKAYYFESELMNSDNQNLFKNIFENLTQKYNFVLHTSNS